MQQIPTARAEPLFTSTQPPLPVPPRTRYSTGSAITSHPVRPRASSALESSSGQRAQWPYDWESTFHEDDISPPLRQQKHRPSPSWSGFGEVKHGMRLIAKRASTSLKSALHTPSGKARTWSRGESSGAQRISREGEGSGGRSRTNLFRKSRSLSTNLDPATLSISLPLPSSRNADLRMPLSYGAGAGARAAAAECSARMESMRSREMEDLAPPTCLYGVKGVKRDSESGISFLSDVQARVDSKNDLTIAPVTKDPITYLPLELTSSILSYLDASSLCKAEGVSRAWKSVANSSPVWREVFLQKFGPKQRPLSPLPRANGGLGLGKGPMGEREWKMMYRLRKVLEYRWQKGAGVAIYLDGHTDGVYCVQYDEDKIITGSRDRTIRVWDMHTFTCKKIIGGPNTANVDIQQQKITNSFTHHLATHPSTVWSARGAAIHPKVYHTPEYYHSASILCLQYDDEILVTGSSDRTLIVWDMKTWQPLHRLCGHNQGVLDIAFDKSKIISCSKDNTICIWDRESGALLQRLFGHNGPVNAVQLRGNLVVSASGDGVARLWNVAVPGHAKCIKEFSSQAKGLACVEFSDDARYLIAGGNNQVIYKYDTITGALVGTMTGHRELVRSLYLDTANARIVSGSYDMSLKVWDFDTGLKIGGGFENWTTSWMLSAKCDYRRIVATSQDGRALIIDFGRDFDGKVVEGMELLEG